MDDEPFLVEFEVPGAVRGKGAGRAAVVGGRSHIFTDSKTRSEMAMVRQYAHQAMNGRPPYEGAVTLMIVAYREVPASFSKTKRKLALEGSIAPSSRPDCDNASKLICDSFNKVVFLDDAQVTDLIVLKRYSDRPRMAVHVKAFGS